jgi:hypothetical protein
MAVIQVEALKKPCRLRMWKILVATQLIQAMTPIPTP